MVLFRMFELNMLLRKMKFCIWMILVPGLRVINFSVDFKLTRLGSEHGWVFVEREYLTDSTLVSVGLGEDASFDIEFIHAHNANVIVVDPTPRAINHFQQIVSSFGAPKEGNYLAGGQQPISSYDLTRVSRNNFVMVPKALWIETGRIDFYSPKDPHHVSYSITNLQKTSESIKVDSICFRDLLIHSNISVTDIGIIKLDVEGAATEILLNIFKDGFRPKQILVELEEMFKISLTNVLKLRLLAKILSESGYCVRHSDGVANFTFEQNQ